jgi:hypothetical protein
MGQFVGAFAKMRKVSILFVVSVLLSICLSAWNNSTFSERIFMTFDIWVFFFWKRNVSYKVVDKLKTLILFSVKFLRKSCLLWENVGKYNKAGEATDDSIIGARALHAGYLRLQTQAFGICNTYWIFAATVVARTPLGVTLHVHCFPCDVN